MKKKLQKWGILGLLLTGMVYSSMGQTLPGTYRASWVGNTWGGKYGKHVQNYIEKMTVAPDGTVYCNAHWDESHWDGQSFKNGESVCNDCSPTVDPTKAGNWSISGSNVVGNGKTIVLQKPTAIALNPGNSNQLIIGESGNKRQILIYDVSGTPTLLESIGAEGGPSANLTIDYDVTSQARYRITGTYPAGNYRPGAYHPFKFWAFTGVGMDSEGRVYMAYNESGCGIKCFRKIAGKWHLDWDVMGMHFVDVCDVDPMSDGTKMYGLQEIYKLDMTKTTPGSEWSLSGYTLDALKYPNDARGIEFIKAGHEHGLTTAWIRYINGKRFMFGQGMTAQWIPVWKFEENSDIAKISTWFQSPHRIYDIKPDLFWLPNSPPGKQIWRDLNNDADYQANEFTSTNYGYSPPCSWVDYNGCIWSSDGSTIWKMTPNGLDTHGNPIYNDANTTTYASGLTNITKLVYLDDRDIMVINTGGEARRLGTVHVYKDFTKGSRTKLHSFVPDKNENPSGLAVAGDYIFTGWSWQRYTTGLSQVWVYDLHTGAYVGMMDPGPELGGAIKTMVDIAYPITAFKRMNGEYLVNIEDDNCGKSIMYRWCPTGDCVPCDTVEVSSFKLNINTDTLTGAESKTIQAIILPDTACRIVEWKSLNPDIASVNDYGKITGIKPGLATIVASADNGELSDTCMVVVEDIPLQNIMFDKDSSTIRLFKQEILKVTFTPENALNKKLYWKTEPDSVASVDSTGVVKALKSGSAAIIVISDQGQLTDTCWLTVPVAIRTPYGGEAMKIPGKIEIEDFDEGGDEIAYKDLEPENNGGKYRPVEGVDIEICTDAGGGFNVGWINTSEWLLYFVDVEAGLYDVFSRVAVNNNSSFSVFLNDSLLNNFSMVPTGGWQNWVDVVKLGVELNAGTKQTLKVLINSSGFNFNYINFLKAVPVESFSLSKDTLILEKGKNSDLMVTVLPTNTTRPGIVWTSKNTALFTVSSSGKVTAKNSIGGAFLIASSVDGFHKDSCWVEVVAPLVNNIVAASNETISIFPNPLSENQLTIEGLQGEVFLEIKDLNGRNVFQEKYFSSGSILVGNLLLSPGMYIISFQNHGKFYSKKFIVD